MCQRKPKWKIAKCNTVTAEPLTDTHTHTHSVPISAVNTAQCMCIRVCIAEWVLFCCLSVCLIIHNSLQQQLALTICVCLCLLSVCCLLLPHSGKLTPALLLLLMLPQLVAAPLYRAEFYTRIHFGFCLWKRLTSLGRKVALPVWLGCLALPRAALLCFSLVWFALVWLKIDMYNMNMYVCSYVYIWAVAVLLTVSVAS